MTVSQLRQLLQEGEGQHLEFKRAEIKSGDLGESLAAMANSGGGWVLLGVDDYGAPIGVNSRKQTLDLVQIAARECVKPALEFSLSEVRLPRGQSVFAIHIPKSQQPALSSSGRVLIRHGSRNVPATPEEVDRLFASHKARADSPFPYEILNHKVKLEILDARGQNATLSRVARVRFLQDQVLALHDRIWGAGEFDLNGEFKPGTIVDSFKADGELYQLVSLREPKHRGELATLEVVHRAQRVFGQDREWFEVEVDRPTRALRVELSFPSDRPPTAAWLTEVRSGRKTRLSGSNLVRRGGHTRIIWTRRNPPLQEKYRTDWTW